MSDVNVKEFIDADVKSEFENDFMADDSVKAKTLPEIKRPSPNYRNKKLLDNSTLKVPAHKHTEPNMEVDQFQRAKNPLSINSRLRQRIKEKQSSQVSSPNPSVSSLKSNSSVSEVSKNVKEDAKPAINPLSINTSSQVSSPNPSVSSSSVSEVSKDLKEDAKTVSKREKSFRFSDSVTTSDGESQRLKSSTVRVKSGSLPISAPMVVHSDPKCRRPLKMVDRWDNVPGVCFQPAGFTQAKDLQSVMWPWIRSLHSLVCVGSSRSGRTTGYLLPIIDLLLFSDVKYPERDENPLVVILCPSSQEVLDVADLACQLRDGDDRHRCKYKTVK